MRLGLHTACRQNVNVMGDGITKTVRKFISTYLSAFKEANIRDNVPIYQSPPKNLLDGDE